MEIEECTENGTTNAPTDASSTSSSSSTTEDDTTETQSSTATSDDTATTNVDENITERRKLIFLLSTHLLNFHRAIIMSRRRSQQRIARRRSMLRGYYMQQMLDIQNSYLDMLPALRKAYQAKAQQEREELRAARAENGEEMNGYDDDDDDEEDQEMSSAEASEPSHPVPRFYEDTMRNFTPAQWLNNFRMSQATFHWLCAQLHDTLKPSGSSAPLRNLISVKKRIAIAVYALASGLDYREIATLFNVSRTSVCKFMKRFAEAVIEKLSDKLLAMPTELPEYDEIRNAFHVASNMPPLVVAALGHCELPVNPVADDIELYTNLAGSTTLIMQALVDDKMLFRQVYMEPERPALRFENQITQLPMHKINDREMSCFVVSPGSFYPLRTWLMRRYTMPRYPHEHDFNDAIDQILQFKDNAFRRLFGRWQILQRKCDLEPKTMELMATACCALHNLLQQQGERYQETWARDIDLVKTMQGKFVNIREQVRDSREATEMRDYLARTISSTEM